VSIGKTWGGQREQRYLAVNAIWKERPKDFAEAADEIASIAMKTAPSIRDQDVLAVTVSYGFDIGIAHGWKNYSARFSPKAWQEKTRQSPGIS
jgi:hypothetical protein